MRKSISPNGLTLSQLEDVEIPEHHTANAKPDSNFIVTMTVALILTQSSSLQMIHRFAQIPGRIHFNTTGECSRPCVNTQRRRCCAGDTRLGPYITRPLASHYKRPC